jgi:peptidoglycan/xylan/chitin deacetylase (PgdA/CDA1 family)
VTASPAGFRTAAKRAAEQALVAVGAARLGRRLRRRRTLVLAYHDIVPAGERPVGDTSLHLSQAAFAAQLDALTATHEVVALADLAAAPRGRPRAVITFDDAYRGALTAGLDETVRRGLPATVFVAPGLLGTTTWWDRLADPASGAVPAGIRDAALSRHRGRGDEVLAAFGAGAATLPAWAAIATEAEVRAAAARPGVTLASHSWSHANLAALDAAGLAAELSRPAEWLRSVPGSLPYLAYPYGLVTDAVAAAAARAGYAAAFRVEGGWLPAAGDPAFADRQRWPRLNIPSNLSPAGFALRAAGVVTR